MSEDRGKRLTNVRAFGKHIDALSEGSLRDALEEIASAVEFKPGDPGPLYDLPERVRRVVAAKRFQR